VFMTEILTLDTFKKHQPKIQSLLEDLVDHESPSTDKTAVDRLGVHLRELCVQIGGTAKIFHSDTAGDQQLIQWGKGDGGFLVLCHMDTVFDLGTLAHRPFKISDGKLFGPGVLDMKAGIAIFISVMRWMHAHRLTPSRPLGVLFTADEELGSQTSKDNILELARSAGVVFCLEPALVNGAVKTERKGTGEIKLQVKGVAAHAGSNHADGRNAIEELSHHILSAQKLTDYDRGTTINTGLIGGGTRVNVVPEEAWADLDFRVTKMDEVVRIQRWAEGLQSRIPGTIVQAVVNLDRPPMPHNALMIQTFSKAKEIASGVGLTLTEGSTGGGSDANFVSQLGVPLLDGLGGVGDGAHSIREYVLQDSLSERAALMAALLLNW
jgi:glutamate carboxypeptidase